MGKNIDDFLSGSEHNAITHKAAPFNLLDETAHDLLDHTGLTGVGGGVDAQNNGGAAQGPRPRLNFIPSGGAGVSVVDDPGNNRINITISAPAAGITTIFTTIGSGSFTTVSGSYTHANATASRFILFFGATRLGAGGALQQIGWGAQFTNTGSFVASNNGHVTAHVVSGVITNEQGAGRILNTSGASVISPTDNSGSVSVTPGGNSGASVAFYYTFS
jgi:hypothetical protein